MNRTTSNTAFLELTSASCRFVNDTVVLCDLPGVHVMSDYEPTDDEIRGELERLLAATPALPATIKYVIDPETLGHNSALTRSAYINALNELLG